MNRSEYNSYVASQKAMCNWLALGLHVQTKISIIHCYFYQFTQIIFTTVKANWKEILISLHLTALFPS